VNAKRHTLSTRAAWLAAIEAAAADAASELAAALLLSVAEAAVLLAVRLAVLELSACASVAAIKVASTSPSTQCLIKVSERKHVKDDGNLTALRHAHGSSRSSWEGYSRPIRT
jgi:hypothetical protein